MAKQMRVGIKAAWITTGGVVLTTILIIVFSKSKNDNKSSSIQKVDQQKVDTGSINNYNAARDLKVENNTFNISRLSLVFHINKKIKIIG